MKNEIDLFTVLKTAWKGRRTIIISTILVTFTGLLFAFLTPRTYTASTVMVPQMQSRGSSLGSLGGLEGLASMAGFNLSGMNQAQEDISPLVYPEIVKSYDFIKDIMNAKYNWSGVDDPVSLVDYTQEFGQPGFFGKIKKGILEIPGKLSAWIAPPPSVATGGDGDRDNLVHITNEEKELWDELTKSILLSVDKKNGYVSLVVNGSEPLATAQIANKAQELLQEKITEFRIKKTKKDLEFIEGRYNDKKAEFEKAQDDLARFLDENVGKLSNRASNEKKRLENQSQLSFTVYSELAKQLETKRISVKEDTPMFSIIQSVIVPVKPSKPRKMVILMMSILIGAALGLTMVFAKKHWRDVE